MSEIRIKSAGDRLDRYELLAEIAHGGMGNVWVARIQGKHGFQKLFAVKTIRAQFAEDPLFQSMFLDEARIASRITHPNVAQILDLGEQDGSLYIVMEWVDGYSLQKLRIAARAAGEEVPARVGLRVVADICAGLHAAHELRDEEGMLLGVVHRDLSPHNIIVTEQGIAKLIDFGVAKARDRTAGETTLGILKGRVQYMAPEQPDGVDVDRRSDVWSIGAVLYALFKGVTPYQAPTQAGTLQRLMAGRPAPPLPSSVPPVIARIVTRALANEKRERFPTALALADALEEAMVASGMSASTADVAALVQKHLADGFRERRSAIEKALRAAEGRSQNASPMSAARGPSTQRSTATASETPPPASPMTGSPPLSSSFAARRARVQGAAFLSAVVAAVAFLTGASAWIVQRKPPTAQAPTGIRAPGPPPLAPRPPPQPACPASMVEIPGGSFFMGSDDDLPTEKPAHRVTLSPFCMGKYEATTVEYKACSDRGECKRAAVTNQWDKIGDHERRVFDPLCNAQEPITRAQHPINCIDWQMANDYCAVGGWRLPTEAEWEFAARGPDGRKYPWGDAPPAADLLNACGKECAAWAVKNRVPQEAAMYLEDDGWATTAPVGSFPRGASRYGVEDIVGNVWEWVSDWYGPYTSEVRHDPRGPESGESRVLRGGGWNGAYAAWVRPSFRYHADPHNRSHGVGLRCAKSL